MINGREVLSTVSYHTAFGTFLPLMEHLQLPYLAFGIPYMSSKHLLPMDNGNVTDKLWQEKLKLALRDTCLVST